MFDVILPTVGRDSLHEAIASVFNQTYKNFTLHIVWHNSKVGTGMGPIYRQERVSLHHLKNGLSDSGASARNHGIAKSEDQQFWGTDHTWIAYLDDDDHWLPEHLELIAARAAEDDAPNMIHTQGQAFRMSLQTGRSTNKTPRNFGAPTLEPLTVSMAHTRELFNCTAGWQPCDNHDQLLWKHMLESGGRPAIIDRTTYHFLRGRR